jgi:hypothetical protein
MNASMGCYQTAVQMAMCQNANVVCGANGMSDTDATVQRLMQNCATAVAARMACCAEATNTSSSWCTGS